MTGIEAQLDAALAEVRKVMLERHAKYGPGNIANAPGGPLNGLRVRMHDKQARINNYVDTGAAADFDDDALRDAFVDTIGYGLIGLMVLDDVWPGLQSARNTVQVAAPPGAGGVFTSVRPEYRFQTFNTRRDYVPVQEG